MISTAPMLDPAGFAFHKSPDIPIGHPPWASHQHLAPGDDLQGNGSAAAADNAVWDIVFFHFIVHNSFK